jgi:hypothetical protein
MTVKEKIALGQLNKELARGILTQAEYALKLRRLQGLAVDPKTEVKAAAARLVQRISQKIKEAKPAAQRAERIDTERVAAKQTGQSSD